MDIFTNEFHKTKSNELKRALYFALKDYKRFLLEEYAKVLRLKQINNQELDIDTLVAEVLMFCLIIKYLTNLMILEKK